jgi:hypothetical protein
LPHDHRPLPPKKRQISNAHTSATISPWLQNGNRRTAMTATNDTLDLLYGTRAIADFLGVNLRAAEHLIETKRIPYFKLGKTVAARRSKLLAAFERLEESHEEAVGA